MYARIVRFTDVSQDAIDDVVGRISGSDGPPEGVDATGMKLFFDQHQGTALFVGFFETEEKMAAADEVLEAMDASDTPGTRASVDRCAVVIKR